MTLQDDLRALRSSYVSANECLNIELRHPDNDQVRTLLRARTWGYGRWGDEGSLARRGYVRLT